MDEFLSKLLNYYSLSKEEFDSISSNPSFLNIPRLDEYTSCQESKKRIQKAIESKEKILIYGDYDCDGIMSTSIIYHCLITLGATVSFFIPSRYKDGYGLNLENAKKIIKKGYGLVILVDNGVSCYEPISTLLKEGIDTLIIDHHELPSSLPPFYALIHNKALNYGPYGVSAGYLSFLFSICLLNKIDPYLLVLGAISTISDTMDLKGYNKEIVRLALSLINKNKYPQIFKLTQKTYIDEKVLGMEVIPCINAVGRMDEGYESFKLVHYFALDNPALENAAKLALSTNLNRKNLTKTAANNFSIDPNSKCICFLSTLKEGLSGLLASRFISTYSLPTAVFASSYLDKNIYVGSLRSKDGFDIISFFNSLGDLPIKKGGHAHAGGISIKKEDYETFKLKFEEYSLSHPLKEEREEEIEISLSDINQSNYKTLKKFSPFGQGNKEPTFIIKDIDTSILAFNKAGYLYTKLGDNSDLFSFQIKQSEIKEKRISLIGKLTLHEYNGKINVRFDCNKEK